LLTAWNDGDPEALDHLIDLLYPELLRVAHQHLGQLSRDEGVDSVTLASEAYLKLVHAGGIHCESRVHFLALCSQIMRRILVDHARRRGSARRGGRSWLVPLDEVLVTAEAPGTDVLALHEALEALGRLDQRKGRLVELRYFGGLTIAEAAEVLGVSDETAKRDWRMAKAWLMAELAR
jgi:RNA polymerase sigma factor (TIGR02999 family)